MRLLRIIGTIFALLLVVRHVRGRYASNIESVAMETKQEIGNIRIVEMPPYIVAKIRTSGNIATAPGKAFGSLGGYIFGDNTVADVSQNIAMTAPVTSQNVSENIAMTAPVTSNQLEEGIIETTFTMPAKRTLETLPIPNNKNVTLEKKPGSTKAIRMFSGFAQEKAVTREWKLFEAALIENNIIWEGSYTLAQYNDPRTPWWMRRNELWVDITDPINGN